MRKRGASHKAPRRLYNIWVEMRARCERITKDSYARYGGRGIKVCSEWHEWDTFRAWALANGYQDELTIERIDVNGNYEPTNCKWIPRGEQARNRRTTCRLTFNGVTMSAAEWARHIGLKDKHGVLKRIRSGWSVEKALTTPPRSKRDNIDEGGK